MSSGIERGKSRLGPAHMACASALYTLPVRCAFERPSERKTKKRNIKERPKDAKKKKQKAANKARLIN